jgi:phosphatidylserine/phosphatidylglycerophosphate/cardiolipin synthase-like enzyme
MNSTGSRDRLFVTAILACLVAATWLTSAGAQQAVTPAGPTCAGPGECLCDSAYQDCRTPILQLINNEQVGIDVSFWFMTDSQYSQALIRRWQRDHLPIRVIVDTQADPTYAGTKAVRDTLVAAGIPIRNYHGTAINHWKMMLFAGQGKVEFSAANYADGSYSPSPITASYLRYVDEVIYFTDDQTLVNSFKKRYDQQWVNPTLYVNFANITGTPTRNYPELVDYPISPDLNFVPDQNYENRLVTQVKTENLKIDAIMFRITSAKLPDALMARFQAGVPVRLITEEQQYRSIAKFWDAYNVDRMYAAGIPIKVKDNTTDQDVHQKSIVLYSRGLSTDPLKRIPMVVFGSSNWTTSSAAEQQEHNYFTTKSWMVDFFAQQFERKWNNQKVDGTPVGTSIYVPFTPLPPETPVYASPANDALGQASSVTLKWEGGWWAHKYDIYFDTTPNFSAPIIADYMPSFATSGVVSAKESFAVTDLLPATTYYWKVVSKTMANMTKTGPTWHFTTAGSVPPPPAPSGLIASPPPGRTRVDLAWNDVAGEEGYKIERKLSTDTTWVQIGTTPADVVTYADINSGLKTETTYNYRVRAFTTGGNSAYSNTIAVKTLAAGLSANDVVLYASKALVRVGKWTPVADATAAGGQRLENLNAGAATQTKPSATPAIYFEMSFNARAGTPYRLWMRGKAYNDSQYNDSVYVQFDDSVDAGGNAVYRFDTLSATQVNIEDCTGCFLKAWGWQDNGQGAGVLGPVIYFASDGLQTLRVQPREDGISIDQIVLSPDTYLTESPGALKSDSTILPEQNNPVGPPDIDPPSVTITSPVEGATVEGIVTVTADATDNVGIARVELWVDGVKQQSDDTAPYSFSWDTRPLADGDHSIEAKTFDRANNPASSGVRAIVVSNPVAPLSTDVILYASEAPIIVGSWNVVADATAAGGARMYQTNAGAAKITTPSANPANYFELTFSADAGVGYRLWIRARADSDNYANDSVHVQFSDSVTNTGAPAFRIGSTTSTEMNLEDCSGCGLSGWGWQDNGWGVGVLGPAIVFQNSGTHTIRIQAREDGVSIDQIVLSPSTYISTAPGPLKNDNTILAR